MKKLAAMLLAGLTLLTVFGCKELTDLLGPGTIEVSGTVTLDQSIAAGHGVWVGLLKSAPFQAPSTVTSWEKYQQISIAPGTSASYTFTEVQPGKYIVGAFYDVNDNGTYDQGEPSGGYPAPNGSPVYDFASSFSQANVTVAFSQAVTGDAQAVATDKAALQITFASGDSEVGVTADLTLPTSGASGTTIIWSSTNVGIISATGVVTQPATTTSVTLVATITKGVASDAKLFTVTVLSGVLTDLEAVAADTGTLAITYSGGDTAAGVTGNLTLPTSGANGTTITWLSSNESLVSTIGVVTRPSAPTTVVLTAMITKGSEIDTKTFVLTILQATLTNTQAVAADKSALQIVFASGDTAAAVTANLILRTSGTNGSAISWSSDNAAVVSAAGVVTRPSAPTTVTLTATITKGSASDTKSFSVTVLQAALTDAQAVAADKSGLQIVFASGDTAAAVTANLTLATSGANGTAIVWTSSDAAVVSAAGVVTRPAATASVTLVATISKGSANDVKIFTLTVLQVTLTDAEAVAADKSAVQIVFATGDTATAVTADLTLSTSGTNGSAISWSSTNTAVVSTAGVVVRPAATTTVTLTATITKGSVSDTKTFSVTVLAAPMTDAQAVATDKSALQIIYASGDTATSVRTDLTLPTTGANGTAISWNTSNAAVVSAAGVVTRPTTTTLVDLTATISKGNASATQVFTVTVLAATLTDAQAVAADKSALQITYTSGDTATSVTGNLILPTSGANGSAITWSSSNTAVVSAAGVVTRPVATTTVTLTATITKGSASDTQVFTVTVILAAPSIPTGLAVGSPTGNGFTVSWSSTPGAASYQLYRNGSLVYNNTGLSFTDSNLAYGTVYSYAVRATNQTGSSTISAAVTGTTSVVTPSGLTVGTPTASSLVVSWTGVGGATSYQVYRDTSSAGTFTTSAYTGTGTSFTDGSLASGTAFYYKILAVYPAGTSALSSAVSGSTSVVIPSGLAVGTPTASSLVVSWTGVNGATSYQVYRDTSSTGAFSTTAYSGTGTSFTDSLDAGTTYYYKVRATYPVGASGLSSAVSGTTSIVIPSGLTVGTPTTSSLVVSWTGVTGATSYQVYRDTSSTGTFATLVYNSTGTSFTNTGLLAGTTYWYKVRGTYPAGTSGLSTAVSGTTVSVYTVTYNDNGAIQGSVPVDATGYTAGQTVTVLGNTGSLVKMNNSFVGWNTQTTGGGTTYTAGQTFAMGTSNVTLYAKWSPTPMARYSFSGNANDSVGANHGTATGGPTYTTDRFGIANSAINLNGSSQYITLPNEASFDFASFTLYAIVKVPSYTNMNMIVTKPSASGYGNYSMDIMPTSYGSNAGKAGYVHDTATGNWSGSITTAPIGVNTFVHVAMTYTSLTFSGYLNGASNTSYTGVAAPVQNNNPVYIGAHLSGSFYFQGAIDEVLIFNRALTSAEITQLYNALK